jgi:hypothetical protein
MPYQCAQRQRDEVALDVTPSWPDLFSACMGVRLVRVVRANELACAVGRTVQCGRAMQRQCALSCSCRSQIGISPCDMYLTVAVERACVCLRIE